MSQITFTNGVYARVWAVVTAVAVLFGAISAPFSLVQAAGASVEGVNALASSYPAGTEIALKVVRGGALPTTGGVDVALSSANGGEFGKANLTTGCNDNGSFSETSADITGNNTQKAFCYRNSNPGEDTITATFTQGEVTEVATLKITIVAAEADEEDNNENQPSENPGQCPAGYEKLMETYEGGLSWVADRNYASVILVGGPDNKNNKDVSGRNKYFSDVAMGDTIARAEHDISHICAIAAQTAEVEMCKLDGEGAPVAGWGMRLTNGTATYELITGEDGCVTEEVVVDFGPWTAIEEQRAGWVQTEVVASGGMVVTLPDSVIEGCTFFAEDTATGDHRCTLTNEFDDPTDPVGQCTLTIVSDETNTVVEKGGAFAKLLSWIHPDWTAIVNAPAAWIWGDDPIADPVVETNQTFERSFGWNGPVVSATLTIAVDNSYTVEVNGVPAGSDATEKNFYTADVFDLKNFIAQGNNTLKVAVKNWQQAGGTTASNPAGLKYELVINGENSNCVVPYISNEEEEENTNPDNDDTTDTTGTSTDNGTTTLPTTPDSDTDPQDDETATNPTNPSVATPSPNTTGNSGTRVGFRTVRGGNGGGVGSVLGASNSTQGAPLGQVLGEQVSAVPYGAAAAGAGGSAVTVVETNTYLHIAPIRRQYAPRTRRA